MKRQRCNSGKPAVFNQRIFLVFILAILAIHKAMPNNDNENEIQRLTERGVKSMNWSNQRATKATQTNIPCQHTKNS